jgi:hypothetical protein
MVQVLTFRNLLSTSLSGASGQITCGCIRCYHMGCSTFQRYAESSRGLSMVHQARSIGGCIRHCHTGCFMFQRYVKSSRGLSMVYQPGSLADTCVFPHEVIHALWFSIVKFKSSKISQWCSRSDHMRMHQILPNDLRFVLMI